MKQAQKLQEDMQRAQQELATLEVTGQAGAGMVEVVMTGKHEAKRASRYPSEPRADAAQRQANPVIP